MKTVSYYDTLLEANIDREYLEQHGIMAMVLNENAANVLPIGTAIASLRPYVVVADKDLHRATEILCIDHDRPIYDCPHCGSDHIVSECFQQKKGNPFLAFFILVFQNIFAGNAPYHKEKVTYRCTACGKNFDTVIT